MWEKNEKLKNWINNATIVDIVCHNDSDGLTAAAQLAKFLKSKNIGYNIYLSSPERLRHPKIWRKLRNDLVFFVDLPVDQQKEEVLKLTNKANVVIIDHHKITEDLNNENIIHYYPKKLGVKKYYPASKMIYDIFGGVDWLACIGLIGDYGGSHWRDFIDKVHEKYGFPKCKDKNCFDSPFSKYDQLINSVRIARGDKGCYKILDILINSKNFEEFKEKIKEVENIAKIVNDYIEFVLSDFKYNHEYIKEGDVIFYELNNPKFVVGSTISVIKSTEITDKTIIVITRQEEIANINFRRQDGKYDMSLLAKICASEVGGVGGGHKKAAGASIPSAKVDEFKECVVRTLKKWVKEKEEKECAPQK